MNADTEIEQHNTSKDRLAIRPAGPLFSDILDIAQQANAMAEAEWKIPDWVPQSIRDGMKEITALNMAAAKRNALGDLLGYPRDFQKSISLFLDKVLADAEDIARWESLELSPDLQAFIQPQLEEKKNYLQWLEDYLAKMEGADGTTDRVKEEFTGEQEDGIIKAAKAPGTISMPNYQKAVTPAEKFIQYSLNYENKKASGKPEAYKRGLGYTQENAEGLIEQIHTAVTSGRVKAFETQTTKYGVKYKYRIAVTGPNGKTKNVIAVYQIDFGSETPRMVTNYLEGK